MKVVWLLLVVSLVGCSRADSDRVSNAGKVTDSREASESLTIVKGESPSDEQRAKMLAAKDALFTQLSGKLTDAMSTGGPAAAISVCKVEAPEVAKRVSEEHGLTIGRTGVRLRNQSNTAPNWASGMVDEKVAEPSFVMLSDGKAAALLPIKLQAQCVMCHGLEDQITPDVKSQLAELYPDDRATGFKEGDLRGWFWIELAGG
jgi:hypothetical protein